MKDVLDPHKIENNLTHRDREGIILGLASILKWDRLEQVTVLDSKIRHGEGVHGLFLTGEEGEWQVQVSSDHGVHDMVLPPRTLIVRPFGGGLHEIGGGDRSKFLINFKEHFSYVHQSWHRKGVVRSDRLISYDTPAHPGSVVEHIFGALVSLKKNSKREAMGLHLLQALVLQFIERYEQSVTPGWSRSEWSFHRLRSFVDQHFRETISRDDLASQARFHPNHVSRLFHQYTGNSLSQYILVKRMDWAGELASSGKLSVQELTEACGFTDKAHFSRCFKRVFDCTPARYGRRGDEFSSKKINP